MCWLFRLCVGEKFRLCVGCLGYVLGRSLGCVLFVLGCLFKSLLGLLCLCYVWYASLLFVLLLIC